MGYDDMEKFIMEDCQRHRDGRKLKAVIPGGSSVYIMPAADIIGKDVKMDYEGLVAAGSMVGSGGFIVMDETVDVFESTKNLTEFYKHESCGWCTPCREGTDWLSRVFKRIARARAAPKTRSCFWTCATTSRANLFARSATPPRGRFNLRSKSFRKISSAI